VKREEKKFDLDKDEGSLRSALARLLSHPKLKFKKLRMETSETTTGAIQGLKMTASSRGSKAVASLISMFCFESI
jgi:hypothetical protein